MELIIIGIILLCTLYKYYEFLDYIKVSNQHINLSPDNDIVGWIVIPMLLLGFAGGLGYIIIVVAALIYFGLVIFSMWWNMWSINKNKDNNLFMKIIGILPAALLAGQVIKTVIDLGQVCNNLFLAIYMIPAVVILVEIIIYTVLVNSEKYN